jgi:restriction system protein
LISPPADAIIECMEDKRKPQPREERNRTNGTYRTNRTYEPPLIPAHGGYRNLKSYQTAEIIYDATVAFCDRFVDRRSRTHDQMVQAGRSGKQNIAEGSQASATSKKTELKLTGVARASLEELLQDYLDFLRQRRLSLWPKDHPHAQAIRRIAYRSDRSYSSYRSYVEQSPPETAANAIICLLHQANYLLDRQLQSLEQRFLAEGGFTERLCAARQHRRQTRPNASHPSNGSYRSHSDDPEDREDR